MPETLTPAPNREQEGLTPQDQDEAQFWRNQQRGTAENMETTGYRVAMAEKAGILAVTQHEKTMQGHQEDMDHFIGKAKEHYDANAEAYQETARREAEAAGHKIAR